MSNRKGKIVVLEGKCPLVEDDVLMGHITTVCNCNATGYAIPLFIILPLLVTLQPELLDFFPEATFETRPSGWMTRNLFYA